MSSVLEPGAGVAVIGLFLGSLAITGAVALVTAPITPRMTVARTVAGANERPTAVSLPAGFGAETGWKRFVAASPEQPQP